MSVLIFKKESSECSSPTLNIPSTRGNTVYSSHKSIYQDISVLKLLCKANFSVHLVRSNVTKRTYAMKVYPHQGEHPSIQYTNETRFACLQHPNVIRSLYYEKQRQAEFDGFPRNISYMIMEHAQNGDMLSLMQDQYTKFNDTLARTYFKQLIQGLEYLHTNEVAHLDIKLDNLLLDTDYILKIADFDMAHFSEDILILSQGTKFYRSPEIQQNSCNDPKAADIYSAGIVLFLLKCQGMFPHLEDQLYDGVNLEDLLKNDIPQFWDKHKRYQGKGRSFFDRDFCDLFVGMTREDPQKRLTIEKIKQSKWYNGPTYEKEELKRIFEESR